MKKILILISCCLLLFTACSRKTVPDWKAASFNHLEQYKKYFLSGRDNLAAIRFEKAVEEIKTSGNLSLLATAYLTRSALRVAVLEPPQDGEYLEIVKAGPADAQKDYYLLLEGKFAGIQKSNLPPNYRDFAAALEGGDEERITKAVLAVQDDLSRLIAVGVTVQYRLENEAILDAAVTLSSHNGWRKPLFVYLARLESFYRKMNDADKAEKIHRRIELLKP